MICILLSVSSGILQPAIQQRAVRPAARMLYLMEELRNAKNAQPGQHFLHICALQIFISLRWKRTYVEST